MTNSKQLKACDVQKITKETKSGLETTYITDFARIFECVDAMSGIDDPQEFIEVFREMVEALKSVKEIIQDSDGIAGYHLNGQIADWDELNLEFEIEKALARAKEVGIV